MRYNNEEIRKRISDKTFEGMSLNINDLGAIGRVLSIQDDAYDEQFYQIFKALKNQNEINKKILDSLDALSKRVEGLEGKIEELTRTINTTRDNVNHLEAKVDCLDKDVQKLKRINSLWYYIWRIAIGVAVGVVIVGLVFGLF